MAKQRTLNEIRQSKEYQLAKNVADANNKNPNITTSNPFEHEEVDKTVDQIVEDLQPQIFDAIFQMINDEMSMRYVFNSAEYLTEAGLELFEDEWFEFYHENHGKIMHKLLQNLK
jgi:23S rRNA maturation-related 3'-5' exoribonuclease YhaM